MPGDPNPRPVQLTAHAARATWVGVLTAAGALELYGILHPGKWDTLSETTRWLARTHTKTGATAFLVGWAGLAIWFPIHLLKVAEQKAQQEG